MSSKLSVFLAVQYKDKKPHKNFWQDESDKKLLHCKHENLREFPSPRNKN